MSPLEDRRYGISEVSRTVDVPVHVLRQWEHRIPQLKPKRDRANRRYYTTDDIEIVKRIKHLIRKERLTTEGVAKRLRREKAGEGRPRDSREALEMLDQIEADVRGLLDKLDRIDDA